MELTIRERSQKVFDCVKTNVNQSLKAIATATGLSQSSVNTVRLSPKRGKLSAAPIKDATIHAAERNVPDFS